MTGIVGGTPVAARAEIVSPAELLRIFLNDQVDRDIVPAGAVVGGADDAQQQKGVVALMDAGNQKPDEASILWKRVQVRCMASGLWEADMIGNYISDLLDRQRWLEIEDTRGRVWFVHEIYVVAGTSHHIDSSETWETLLFVNLTVSRNPVIS